MYQYLSSDVLVIDPVSDMLEPVELSLVRLGRNLLLSELPSEEGVGDPSLSDPDRGVGERDFFNSGETDIPVKSVKAMDNSRRL